MHENGSVVPKADKQISQILLPKAKHTKQHVYPTDPIYCNEAP